MLELLLWTSLSFIAFMLSTLVYVWTSAIVGRCFGIKVNIVAVGYDIGSWYVSWPGRHWEWRLGFCPLGGYTKFRGRDDGETDRPNLVVKPAPPDAPADSFPAASLGAKITTMLSGPLSQFVLAAILFAIPVCSGGDQLSLSSGEDSTIRPVAVGGINSASGPSSFEGQFQFAAAILSQAFQKFFLYRSFDEWGGFVGGLVTIGAAGTHSWMAWTTCVATLCFIFGVFNLLPIPA
ncbi:MAG: membrane-associated protease RseP (regulator of RpoE activity) [Pirellulaceae bacterium]|jgi:membrane-associated protease RseP (regulator of RpoE activity)